MTKYKQVLIVEDHPLIIEAYKRALENYSLQDSATQFHIHIANDCDGAEQIINSTALHLVFLDVKVPMSKDKRLLSGEDLGILLHKKQPDVKLIMATTLSDNYRLHSVLSNVNPQALLIKNDITSRELVDAIEMVLQDKIYYSQTVMELLRKKMTHTFTLDAIDRRLLYELSIGTKMKEIPKLLPLSIAGVEKRKRRLIGLFEVEEQGDRALIQAALDKGFI